MKAAETDILFVPGYLGSGPEHWQSRWAAHFATGRWVEGPDWTVLDSAAWISGVLEAARTATRPVVLVGHSMGVATIVHAAQQLEVKTVKGAFLVAYADVEANSWISGADTEFAPMPRDPLPFPSLLVASRDDPHCAYDVAGNLGAAWGSLLVDAGTAGHLNTESGHGPWPDGGLTFGKFLSRLQAA